MESTIFRDKPKDYTSSQFLPNIHPTTMVVMEGEGGREPVAVVKDESKLHRASSKLRNKLNTIKNRFVKPKTNPETETTNVAAGSTSRQPDNQSIKAHTLPYSRGRRRRHDHDHRRGRSNTNTTSGSSNTSSIHDSNKSFVNERAANISAINRENDDHVQHAPTNATATDAIATADAIDAASNAATYATTPVDTTATDATTTIAPTGAATDAPDTDAAPTTTVKRTTVCSTVKLPRSESTTQADHIKEMIKSMSSLSVEEVRQIIDAVSAGKDQTIVETSMQETSTGTLPDDKQVNSVIDKENVEPSGYDRVESPASNDNNTTAMIGTIEDAPGGFYE